MPPSLLLRPRGLPKRGLVGYWKFDERKNLLKFSQQFDNAAWVKGANVTITPNAVAAPDGTTTADTYANAVAAADADANRLKQSVTTPTTLGACVGSVWLRAAAPVTVRIQLIDTLVRGTTDCAVTTAWQRFTVAGTFTGTTQTLSIGPDGTNVVGTVYVWGAQLEANPYATTYYPTTDKQILMDYSRPRKNLLLPNQANAGEDGTTGGFDKWGSGTVTVTSDTSQYWQRARSLKVVCDGTQPTQGAYTTYYCFGLNPFGTYTGSVYVKGTAGAALTLQMVERLDTGSGVTINSVQAVNFTATGGWDRITVTKTFGADGRAANLRVITQGSLATTFYIDGLQLEEGSVATDWQAPPNHGILGSSLGADTNDPTWTGQGASFGADDGVSIPSTTIANTQGATLIIVFSSTKSTKGNSRIYFNLGSIPPYPGLALSLNRTVVGKLDVYHGSYETEFGSGLNDGAPHLVVAVLDGAGTLSVSIDGAPPDVRTGITQNTYLLPESGKDSGLGNNPVTFAESLEGTLSVFGIYLRALSDAEVAQAHAWLRSYLAKFGVVLP